ncbi:MAG TPA: hypothetical protein VG406_30120 [Isosphaeraceae bacterium]|jgi:hypothetical protein|nr:hypothetical protein [Isosphaeraceae bacterium]
MRLRAWVVVGMIAWGALAAVGGGRDRDEAAERGRVALTGTGYLKPAWGADAYKKAGRFWGPDAPDPDHDPEAYAAAFRDRYGLHPAPYPNDGFPMGLRHGNGPNGTKVGLQIDCLVCHGGSIGGTSYVGLGNSTLDLKSLFDDLTRAEDRIPPPPIFTLTTARGTVNAGQVSAILWSFRNPDLTRRRFPLLLGTDLPELDTPAWWLLGKKATQYYDGRTDARSVRTNMQFLLGEKTLDEFKALEPTFRDIQVFLKSLKSPKYPFPIDRERAGRGETVFHATCARCHGTYGTGGSYPNKVVELDVIGTDPDRARGLSDRLVAHYNSSWFGSDYPVETELVGYQAPPLDGVWATAPYLHNGSVPTLAHLLKSSTRPDRFRRPPSTDFAHYDTTRVGWTFDAVAEPPSPDLPPHEARSIYDTHRRGLGNRGHTFGDKLTDEERSDLIEYLKTL